MSDKPTWDNKGKPTNLEAAAADALEWLKLWQGYQSRYLSGDGPTSGPIRVPFIDNSADNQRTLKANQRRMKAAIAALEGFLPKEAEE